MKKLLKIFTALASLSLLASAFTGCSDVAENNVASEYTTGYGRVAFSGVSDEATLTNIVFKATSGTSTKTYGDWATVAALKAATVQIPVGTYTFYLSATYAGDTVSGSTTGTITENETTALSFTLTRGALAVPEDNDPDEDDVPETVTKGELVTTGEYEGLYQVLSWNANDYVFGRTTVTGSSSNDKIASPGTYGDVTVVGKAYTKVTAASDGSLVSGGYIQLPKNGSTANGLKFAVPVNVHYITVGAKSGSSSSSTVKMTISLSDGSEKEEVSITGTNFTPEQKFAYSLTPEDGETQKVICIYNSDTSYSLNIQTISVYAPTVWEKIEGTISTKTSTATTETYEDDTDPVINLTVTAAPTTSASSISIKKAEGWLNSAYVIFDDTATSYTITCDGTKVDDELLRHYSTYKYNELSYKDGQSTWAEKSYTNVARVDVLGLTKGEHTISITPAGGSATTVTVNVLDHDRSGYAFTGQQTPGAYKMDGTLKDNATVLYVTKDTAKTISIERYIDAKHTKTGVFTGLQAITDNSGAFKYDDRPIAIRIIGTIGIGDLDATNSNEEGLQVKGQNKYHVMPLTIEGVGHDATVTGWGFLFRNTAYIETNNFAIMNCLDDCVSLDTANEYSWVHNMDFFYGSAGKDKDQAKGDGTIDLKGGTRYQTYSYNHFWDSGKSSLCGMGGDDPNYITYHHNWFDHSDSRHPRIRNMTVHIYNNYFDGNAKYGVGVTTGASAFVECNFFRNPHDPMMSSRQGTDATGDGTFSGESGGWIKAFNNKYYQLGANGVKFQHMTNLDEGWESTDANIDCYIVENRTDKVPALKTVVGGTVYSNFDTEADFYLQDAPESPDAALNNVLAIGGRHNPDFAFTFNNVTADASYAIDTTLKSAVVAYQNTGLTKVGQ